MNGAEILVSGATGRTGGTAIDELLKMGKRVRAYVRTDDHRAAELRLRGVDIAVGDFTDIDQIRAAMEGIRSAYFLHPIAPGIIGAAAYFAQAAKEAGVTAIANMSQISARRESAATPRRTTGSPSGFLTVQAYLRRISGRPSSPIGSFIRILRRRSGPRRRSNFPSPTDATHPSRPTIRAGSSPISSPIPRGTKARPTHCTDQSR